MDHNNTSSLHENPVPLYARLQHCSVHTATKGESGGESRVRSVQILLREEKQKHDSNGGPTTCARHTLIKCMRPRCETRSPRGSDRASMIIGYGRKMYVRSVGDSSTPLRASSRYASLLHFMPPMLNSAETVFASLSACVQACHKYQLVFPPTYGILVHLTDCATATGEAAR